MKKLSHITSRGKLKIVDIGNKPIQKRIVQATGEIRLQPSTLKLLKKQALPKGDALTCAQVAGIQAAKKTSELIPLCHTLNLDSVEIDFQVSNHSIRIEASTLCHGKTGAEMEALTAVAIAGLTLYDMFKAVDKKIKITNLKVLSKKKISNSKF